MKELSEMQSSKKIDDFMMSLILHFAKYFICAGAPSSSMLEGAARDAVKRSGLGSGAISKYFDLLQQKCEKSV